MDRDGTTELVALLQQTLEEIERAKALVKHASLRLSVAPGCANHSPKSRKGCTGAVIGFCGLRQRMPAPGRIGFTGL